MDLKARVTNILTRPKVEWPIIASEPTGIATLYEEYIAILAAIPPICTFVGMTLTGISLPFFARTRVGLGPAISRMVVSYVFALAGVYAAAFVIDRLAPKFDSRRGILPALKLVAYASTAHWVAGLLNLVPGLGGLRVLAAVYGIYLSYLGFPVLMNTPRHRVAPYLVVSGVAIIVVFLIAQVFFSALNSTFFHI